MTFRYASERALASLSQRLPLCLLLVSTAASAQTYSITILDSPGGRLRWANSINTQGQIVGIGETATGSGWHAIQRNDGTPLHLGTGDCTEAEALAINSTRQVAGWRGGGFLFSATLWSGGSPAALPGLGVGRSVYRISVNSTVAEGNLVRQPLPRGDQ